MCQHDIRILQRSPIITLTERIIIARQRIGRAHVSEIRSRRLNGYIALHNGHVFMFDQRADRVHPAGRPTHARVAGLFVLEVLYGDVGVVFANHGDRKVVDAGVGRSGCNGKERKFISFVLLGDLVRSKCMIQH